MLRLAFSLVVLTGCQLVFDHGGDDSCPPIAYDLAPAIQLRNPQNGLCTGFGQPYPCDTSCGPCAEPANAQPDWGQCFGMCEQIVQSGANSMAQEASCIAQAGCRAIYIDPGAINAPPKFADCWSIAPSGPVKGECAQLDAQQCSRHDDCAAVHDDTNQFLRCVPEHVTTPVACDTLSTETQCTARTDCNPVYRGEDCTCTPDDCTCKILTYTRCQSK